MIRPVFPFTALVGQAAMKRALLLNAVNPRLGGVLVRGQKGTAKSTAVRALAGLLPEIDVVDGCPFGCDPDDAAAQCDDCRARAAEGEPLLRRRQRVPLVELPVGATEDRVVGTLDIERAIKQGERHFEPGLLAASNRGILYVDEVNLLNDHLVDVLLDAAALGTHYVEREGLSLRHPAQFILVGTMNPEEGELRPQLLDRFGLAVDVGGLDGPAERADVVRRRIAFERAPETFARQWRVAEAAERRRILAARRRLPRVRVPGALLDLITRICQAFEVDGLRADIVMYKATGTVAAYAGRTQATEDDVRIAADLALPHRRRRQPFEQPGFDRQQLDETIARWRAEQSPPAADEADPPPAHEDQAPDGQPPEEGSEQVFETGVPFRVRPLATGAVPEAAPRGRRSKARASAYGAYVRSQPAGGAMADLAFDATLRAAAPHQVARRAALTSPPFSPSPLAERSPKATRPGEGTEGEAPPALLLERWDLQRKVREARTGNLIVFVVDASGSMGAERRMVAVKGAVLSLLPEAYQRRDEVALVAFRGTGAEVLLPPTSSVELAERCLRLLPTGGRTPLAHGLRAGHELLARRGADGAPPLVMLLSDGRANVPLAGGDPLQEAVACGAALRRVSATTVVVDTEIGFPRLGLARQLAAGLGARYVRLEELAAGPLAGVVHDHLA
ncbi:MAG: magnesium chelatase subunit D family protein [Chloroflexi bacterium]|nr:magnesium chelatase subunit D family protein [Chloroflexota bacterium]